MSSILHHKISKDLIIYNIKNKLSSIFLVFAHNILHIISYNTEWRTKSDVFELITQVLVLVCKKLLRETHLN